MNRVQKSYQRKRDVKKNCQLCNTNFLAAMEAAMYCSDACKKKATHARNKITGENRSNGVSARIQSKATLCWECKWEVFLKCSWHKPKGRTPVEGWTATRSTEIKDDKEVLYSYSVHKCPKFVKENRNKGVEL